MGKRGPITHAFGKLFGKLFMYRAFDRVSLINKSPFLNDLRNHMLMMRYSERTLDSYLQWIKYFIVSHKKQHLY